MASIVDYAEAVAFDLLADSLSRRCAHTVGVAAAADRFARTLAPHCAERVVAAAWLHDIGYAPDLVASFHPIDGAAYVARSHSSVLSDVVGLIAHHTGAAFEAAERGLENELARYRFPVDVEELALLNAADLCTSPDGVFVDPQARLTEVLDRYPPDNPVHRAVAKSCSILVAQARLVLGAAEAAEYREPQADFLPESVECVEPGPRWQAVWSGDDRRVVTAARPAPPATGPGIVEIRFDARKPLSEWEPETVDFLDADVRAAAEAASGGQLNWHEYRAYEIVRGDGAPQRSAELCALTPWGSVLTFYFDTLAALQLDMAAQGRSIQGQLRTTITLSEVTEWQDIPPVFIDGPIDLRSPRQIPNPTAEPSAR